MCFSFNLRTLTWQFVTEGIKTIHIKLHWQQFKGKKKPKPQDFLVNFILKFFKIFTFHELEYLNVLFSAAQLHVYCRYIWCLHHWRTSWVKTWESAAELTCAVTVFHHRKFSWWNCCSLDGRERRRFPSTVIKSQQTLIIPNEQGGTKYLQLEEEKRKRAKEKEKHTDFKYSLFPIQ